MFKGLRWLALVIGGVLLSPLGGCDQPPPQAEHVLKVAKADNAMDEAIRKSSGQSWKPPAAKIDLSPAAIDFPAVGVGGSASRTIEVANGGDLAATITQIHVVGQSASFRLGGDCVAVTEIAAGHGCSIVVTFEPQSEGPASAELVMVLGDVAGLPNEVVARATAAGEALRQAPVMVRFDKAGSFVRRHRTLPLVLRGSGQVIPLIAFQHALGEAMARQGFRHVPVAHYTPHMTLLYDPRYVEAREVTPVEWMARDFVLIRSVIGKARHEVLGRWGLDVNSETGAGYPDERSSPPMGKTVKNWR